MSYLEQRGIVHRDLAARNVLGEVTRFYCIFAIYITTMARFEWNINCVSRRCKILYFFSKSEPCNHTYTATMYETKQTKKIK